MCGSHLSDSNALFLIIQLDRFRLPTLKPPPWSNKAGSLVVAKPVTRLQQAAAAAAFLPDTISQNTSGASTNIAANYPSTCYATTGVIGSPSVGSFLKCGVITSTSLFTNAFPGAKETGEPPIRSIRLSPLGYKTLKSYLNDYLLSPFLLLTNYLIMEG
ncbi:unnamed protein product [Protopolystoma xenopodis]|uniref:Uncharacterized protein n=1 Tax=Protopolystoma xenopodis TaxID=117903 RepID=A0A3S5AYU5_9PLAT|nr:unnamed protein product [Protopolystoma xenopodis]